MFDRNLESYLEEFKKLPFERYQEKYRRRFVTSYLLNKINYNAHYLEVGCGLKPLFTDFKKDIKFDVIEPIKEFVDNANYKANSGYNNVNIYNSFLEEFQLEKKYDLIICSCLLHEVPKQNLFLEKLKKLMHSKSILHINVPNANSLHRRLGERMNILNSSNSKTKTQKLMQQNNNAFTIQTLSEFTKKHFQVIESGGYFLKPFSHMQMQKMIDKKIIDEKVLDAFYLEGIISPGIASEIYLNMKIK